MADKKDETDGGKVFYFTAFNAKHLTEDIEGLILHHESFSKDKMKTLTVALVVCLHLEVDPPDVPKISPCCRIEAWYDPTGRNPYRSIEQIGENLQQQYERWQSKARYKKCLDPTLEEVKKLCLNLRRNAKDDRVLFHYNGHGVPRPTQNGEIWVFNKTYTKYIPLNLLDLQQWMGSPSLYVFDCHRAGLLINKFYETYHKSGLQNLSQINSVDSIREHTIILAACGADEDLSQNPEIPADLFTACLTTPIRMAVQWYWLNNRHRYPAFLEEIIFNSIPGSFSNRQSMLGELNWIFTAVTDTIAWSCFNMDLFQKLFRQDMLVASLFRNFLLAERIGKAYGVHPVAHPTLPSTAGHPMWASWDEALDQLMDQLISLYPILTNKKGSIPSTSPSTGPPGAAASNSTSHVLSGPPLPPNPTPASTAPYVSQRGLPVGVAFNGPGMDVGDIDLVMAGDVFLGGTDDLPILKHAPEETVASRQPLHLPKDLFDFDDSEGESNLSMHERADASNGSVTSSGSHASSPETSDPVSLRRVPAEVILHTQQMSASQARLAPPKPPVNPRKGSADILGGNMHAQGASSAMLPIAQSSLPKHQQSHTLQPPSQNINLGGKLVRTPSGTGAMLFGTPGMQYGMHPVIGSAGVYHPIQNTFTNGNGGYGNITLTSGEQIRYRSATFFADQLRAFEIWLTTANEQMSPAMQLPILLQVLLSQIHRIHALELLCYYVDLGAWAVKHCLAVGIFPYVVRLLQSNVNEVKPLLVFLWCKIIACAETDFTKHDAVRESGYRYFSSCFSRVSHIKPQTCIMATFVLAKMLDGSPVCQEIFLKDNFLSVIKAQLLDNPHTMNNDNYIQLRHWLILCLAKLWYKNDAAKWAGVRNNMQEELFSYLHDVSPLVRASTILALRAFVDISSAGGVSDHAIQLNHEVGLRVCRACILDGSPLVRGELLSLLAVFLCQFESQLISIASRAILEAMNPSRASLTSQLGLTRQSSVTTISRVNSRSDMLLHSGGDASPHQTFHTPNTNSIVIGNMIHSNQAGMGNVYSQLWRSLIILSHDPYASLAEKARILVGYILSKIKDVGGVNSTFVIPRISTDTRSGPQSEVGSPDSVHFDTAIIRQSSPGIGSSNDAGQGPSGNTIHSAVFTAPSRTRIPILPGNWSGFGQVTKGESGPILSAGHHAGHPPPDMSRVCHFHEDASAPTSTNSVHYKYNPDASAVSAVAIRDLAETQLFAWCCRQFSETGHRYQLFSPQGFVGIANNRPVITAVQHCKIAGSASNMTFSSYQGDGYPSFATPVTLQPFSMMGEDSSSLLRANREHLLQQHAEINLSGKRLWSEISRVTHPTTLSHSALTTHKSHSVSSTSLNSLHHHSHQHSLKNHHTVIPDSVGDLSLAAPVQLSQYMLLRGRQHPLLIRFHPYLSHLAVAEPGGVSIWDLQKGERRRYLNLISAQLTITESDDTNASGLFAANWRLPDWNANTLSNIGNEFTYSADVPLVTTLEFVNSHEERSLLLNGTSDGTVFVWRNYFPDLNQDKELVTAWYALTDLLHSNRPAGMVSHWHQSTGQLTVSGDVKVVRIWDTQQEARVLDMPTGAESCVSALDRSKDGRLVVAGMGDGYVRLFDTRAPAGEVMVSGGQGDLGWIHTIAFSGAENAIYSVDHYGRINLWNITNRPSRIMTNPSGMSSFSGTEKEQGSEGYGSLHSAPQIQAHDDKLSFSNLPRNHPRRKALEPGTDSYKGITRLGRGIIPSALSQPLQSVYCASLKVDGSETRDHLALLGHGVDTREVTMAKVSSGSTHASYRYREGFSRENIGVPLCVGFHSNQPFVGVGTSDSLITVLEAKWK